MARPIICNWTPVDFQAVCQTQDANGGDSLVLNGTFSTFSGVVVFPSMTRTVIISSFNDLTGVNFTINGTANGQNITEVLAGANNAIATSVNLFSTITSITVDNDALQFAIGTGPTGHTSWLLYDYNQPSYNQVTIAVKVTGNITYSFQATLDDITTIPAAEIYSFDSTGGQLTNQNANAVGASPACVRYYCVFVNAADNDASLNATFLPQGV